MAKKMAIIATKGTLDMAYPPLILASTAAALGWDVQIFFTFYGLQLLRKDLSGIAISPLANPAMPMPVPMPVIVSVLPGMEAMATSMMKAKMKKKGVASLQELRDRPLPGGGRQVHRLPDDGRPVRVPDQRIHRWHRVRRRGDLHEVRRRNRRLPVHLNRCARGGSWTSPPRSSRPAASCWRWPSARSRSAPSSAPGLIQDTLGQVAGAPNH